MIYSSYYGRKGLRELCRRRGLELLCVSRSVCRGFEDIRVSEEVLVSWDIIRMVKWGRNDYEGYKRRYWNEILRFVDVKEWIRRNDNCVMLCWEKEVVKCHRYLLGKWIVWGGGEYGGEI